MRWLPIRRTRGSPSASSLRGSRCSTWPGRRARSGRPGRVRLLDLNHRTDNFGRLRLLPREGPCSVTIHTSGIHRHPAVPAGRSDRSTHHDPGACSMQPIGRAVRFWGAVGTLMLVGTEALAAQGVTSAAVQGRIISESRGTVENAIVALTNTSTGTRQQTTTGSAGRYTFENVPPGGPYTMEVRAIGFQPATKTGIMLTLGQRYLQDFELKQSVVTLQELTVVAATNPLINSGRTGPAQSVSDTSIARIPILGRNFTSLLNMSPQVVPNNAGGFSIGGQNPRFNTIMIDGSVDNDLCGLAAGGGVPGARVGGKALSLEALKEFQILTAPFDVRQGGFSGGLVNGITKSGSNQFHGSMFGYIQRPELVGKDTALAKVTTFDIKQFGGTLGGPIIRNKLHFFVAVDVQSRQSPLFSAEVSQPTTGITQTTANRVRQITIDKLGFDPGGPEPPTLDQPDNSYFGKLNWQIGSSTQLEVSGNIVNASADNLARGTRNRVDRDGFQLSNSGFNFVDHTRNIRSKLNTIIGKANLELLFGRTTIADDRTIPNQVPLILVQGDVANNYIAAGGEKFSQANTLDQKIHEATANLTLPLGRHEITVGTHNEFFSFVNVFWQGRYGVWTFNSVNAYDSLTPNRYEIQLALRPNGPIADFNVKQYGGYLQDRWTLADNVTLTGGLRLDVPSNPHPVANPLTQLVDTLGVHTDRFPTGNQLWSPRLGFNWDPGGNGNTIVRGGVGVFTGRPPYVWISNAFTNTGLDQTTLICTPAAGGGPAGRGGELLRRQLQVAAGAQVRARRGSEAPLGHGRHRGLPGDPGPQHPLPDRRQRAARRGERRGPPTLRGREPRRERLAHPAQADRAHGGRGGPSLQSRRRFLPAIHLPAGQALQQRGGVQRRLHPLRGHGPDDLHLGHRDLQPPEHRAGRAPGESESAHFGPLDTPQDLDFRHGESAVRRPGVPALHGPQRLAVRLHRQRRRQRRRHDRERPRLRPQGRDRHQPRHPRGLGPAQRLHRERAVPSGAAWPHHGAELLPEPVEQIPGRPALQGGAHPERPALRDPGRRIQFPEHPEPGLGLEPPDQHLRGAGAAQPRELRHPGHRERGRRPRALHPQHDEFLPEAGPDRLEPVADSARRQVYVLGGSE